ncbi:hypothetical protein NP493_524g02009 [Ridgeia piscesae]|uniref:Uncharacterized protein n=1 Tax=Ridgeia piscesae TaxID=27915 RepID=A0AAD9KWU9_RIDPI|nr:hypothetical protein NP493_524g02009 [Ridgeia piscesae]
MSKQVTCSKQKCGVLEGCHTILFDKPKDVCCDVCKDPKHRVLAPNAISTPHRGIISVDTSGVCGVANPVKI